MLLAALAATIAVTVFADQQRWTRAVEHRRDQVQAQALAFAAVQWARQVLNEDARVTQIDHLGEPWAITLPPIPLDNGEIRGAIVDAQGRLNVNAVAGGGKAAEIDQARLRQLFAARGGPVAVVEAIADWIDADAAPRSDGAEDAFYAVRDAPGLAANAPLVRVAELANVRGVSPETLAAVAPFLIALPAGMPLNVNTAPAEVLAAVFGDRGGAAAAAIVAARAARPFNSIGDLRARVPQAEIGPNDVSLAVRSEYFLVSVEARQGTTLARARALLQRASSGRTWPTVVWQVVE
jgi:general secretion pathway protein K